MSLEDGKFRTGPALAFDPIKEKYIVERLDDLARSRKLGPLLSDIVRVVFDDPKQLNYEANMQKLLSEIKSLGMHPNTYDFFEQKNKEMAALKQRVDAIYTMVLQIYTLAMFGKRLGLEEQAKNSARAEFMLERQIEHMMTSLGMTYNRVLFESIKTDTVEKKAADMLEYLIKSYDGVIKEIVAEAQPQKVEIPIPEVVMTQGPRIGAQVAGNALKDVVENQNKVVENPDDTPKKSGSNSNVNSDNVKNSTDENTEASDKQTDEHGFNIVNNSMFGGAIVEFGTETEDDDDALDGIGRMFGD